MKKFLTSVVWFIAILPAWAQEAPASHAFHFLLPDKNWALDLPNSELKLEENELYNPSSSTNGFAKKMSAESGQKDFVVSAFLYPAVNQGDSRNVREYNWSQLKNAPVKRTGIRRFENGNRAFLEYMVPKFQGVAIHQKNLWVHEVKGDTWVDVHLSKTNFKPEDQAWFDDFLNHMQIVEPFPGAALQLAGEASHYYLRHDYQPAAFLYQKSLDLEKRTPTLSVTMRRVVLDNLGMAYALSGDLAHAKSIFEYGIWTDPEYPMSYYNLACYYAEEGDKKQALAKLSLAFKRKSHINQGESLPDPRKDSSFKNFVNDRDFTHLVQQNLAQ